MVKNQVRQSMALICSSIISSSVYRAALQMAGVRFLVMDQWISALPQCPEKVHRKAAIWIVTHTLAFAIVVQLSIVMLWCISLWHEGKLVVIVHVIRIILQFDGSGQGLFVVSCMADTHAHAHAHAHANKIPWKRSVLLRVTAESTILIVVLWRVS